MKIRVHVFHNFKLDLLGAAETTPRYSGKNLDSTFVEGHDRRLLYSIFGHDSFSWCGGASELKVRNLLHLVIQWVLVLIQNPFKIHLNAGTTAQYNQYSRLYYNKCVIINFIGSLHYLCLYNFHEADLVFPTN